MRPAPLLLLSLLLMVPPAIADDRLAGEWRLALAGDIMLGTDYPVSALPAQEGRGLMDAAEPSLAWADIAIGNLEGAMSTGGMTGKQGCEKCYAFRTPPHFAQRLREAGFHGMSQANNHARDFGEEGLRQSTHALERVGMKGTGWHGSKPATFQHEGRIACLLAFAPNKGMNDIRDLNRAAELVRQAKPHCSLTIVSFHGGAEGSDKTHTPHGAEMYLGENRGDVRAFARTVIDAGAHLVFGHGPHVPRGMEIYRGHLVSYSLGNFMTYGGMNVTGVLGEAPLLLVRLDEKGKLVAGRVVPFRQTKKQPLKLDPGMDAARTIMRATQRDFGGGELLFTPDGGFRPNP